MIWAQQTTKPYKGLRKGRQWSMVYNDVERLRRQVPELSTVTPMLSIGEHRLSSATRKALAM